jgi:hypothetical protein
MWGTAMCDNNGCQPVHMHYEEPCGSEELVVTVVDHTTSV